MLQMQQALFEFIMINSIPFRFPSIVILPIFYYKIIKGILRLKIKMMTSGMVFK